MYPTSIPCPYPECNYEIPIPTRVNNDLVSCPHCHRSVEILIRTSSNGNDHIIVSPESILPNHT